MTSPKREPGFYWVHEHGVGWIVCRWAPVRGWDRPGSSDIWVDEDFAFIGAKIECPYEPTPEMQAVNDAVRNGAPTGFDMATLASKVDSWPAGHDGIHPKP